MGVATLRANPRLVFTAFEPSGDDHAAPVIAELKRRHPGLSIFAWGGRKMEAAGATIVERTGDDAVMGLPGFAKILEHSRINRRFDDWLEDHPVSLHVPVDSPAANFPLCVRSKSRGLKVAHLVAPQVWAWGPWRVNKLRRLTDLVLCFLPFEEAFFQARNVPATFIGHPLFDEPLDVHAIDARVAASPQVFATDGEPKVALMPGSRPGELSRTFPVLLDAFRRVRADFPRARAVMAVTKPEVESQLRDRAARLGGWPAGMSAVAGDTDAVVRWCDFALTKSGTITLHLARQGKPMVTFYRPNKLMYYTLAKWIVRTPVFTLPNLIAGRRIVPELIPHFGDGLDLYRGALRIMRQPGFSDDQKAALAAVCARFEGLHAAVSAADAIERLVGLGPSAGAPGSSGAVGVATGAAVTYSTNGARIALGPRATSATV